MAYVPKSPPFSAREKAIDGSLPDHIPVTSVTEVTSARRRSTEGDGAGRAGAINRPELASLLNQWMREKCVASWRCASNVDSLRREFFRWAGLYRDTGHAFVEMLYAQGLTSDESGMLEGVALAADFMAALEYERPDKSLPAQKAGIYQREVFPCR